ncbi:hypothetical protein WR25_27206 [Diploscapter pachys]|uniref:N-acetyltransferase domain-containing protein n=1 Tax=Diploscapter pachys TaxID=2018661 RepID=A0A2A2K4W4_9BILA|nr:hypothetical protein WR25_27206 [Diploscapter pachys]
MALDGTRGLRVELTLALDADAPDRLLGFALVLPAQDNPQACALAYLAVDANHRRKGIARGLLDAVRGRYACVELSAFAQQVPWFENMGLQVVASAGPQAERLRDVRLDTLAEQARACVSERKRVH